MSQINVHPSAVVARGAHLGEGVVVKPYAVIDEPVEIGSGTVVGPHCVLHSFSRLGEGNYIHAHAVIGDTPQDLSFVKMETWVEIGDDNVIREGVTIHRSTDRKRPTRVGSKCFLMAYSHVAHDCEVGDGVILTNNVALAGHVQIGDKVVLGGAVAVHQFVRIGPYAMVAGFIPVRKDVLPYSMLAGDPVCHYRLNTIGLRRAGITGHSYHALEKAFRALSVGSDLTEVPETKEVHVLRKWLAEHSKRGVYGFLRQG